MTELQVPWRVKGLGPVKEIRFVITHDGEAIAMIAGITDGEVTYLTDLVVSAEHRGKQYGTQLMRQFLDAAKGTTIILFTSGAQDFYRKFGFVERTAMVRRPE